MFIVIKPSPGFAGNPVRGLRFGSKRANMLAAPVGPNDFNVPHFLALEFSRLEVWWVIATGHDI
jgi:hypothetical protein